MDNSRPASRNRRRSILTTTISASVNPAGGAHPEATKNSSEKAKKKSSININQKGYRQDQSNDYGGGGSGQLKDSPMITPSIFRSPSLEERLAQLGIDLSGGSGAAGPGRDAAGWKGTSDNVTISSGGESGGGGSGRSVNSISSGGIGQGSDLSARKSARLSTDISKRISGISSSMDQYDRKVKDVQETMQAAYRNTVQDRRRLKHGQDGSPSQAIGRDGDSSSGSLDMDADDFLQKCRESLQKDLFSEFDSVPSSPFVVGPGGDNNNNDDLDLQLPPSASQNSSPRKIFGLDATAILKSSSSESSESSSEEDAHPHKSDDSEDSSSSSSEEEGAATMKISIRQPASTGKAVKSAAMKRFQENIKNRQQQPQNKEGRPPPGARGRVAAKKKQKKEDLIPPRSLSPIMPTVPDKQFQTMLERREERVSRHLTSMKNELAQLNQKVEMDKRKASDGGARGTRGIMPHSYQGRPMRLMQAPPEKNLGNDFSAFVQSTGGQAGGWERKDHNSFLKVFDVWRKHPNKLMEALKKDLPHKKSQEIASHIKWYERFEQLSSANRANVHQWSQDKRRESELIYQMGSASQRAKLEGDKRRQEHLRMIREQERDRGKEKLAQWKRSQAVRSATSATSSSQPQGPVTLQTATASSSSTAFAHQQNHHNRHLFQQRPQSTEYDNTMEHRHRPTSTNTTVPAVSGTSDIVDIAGVRQHILDITAKVHALDNPKRDFRPPRPSLGVGDVRRIRSRPGVEHQEEEANDFRKLGVSRSFTNVLARPPTPPLHPHPPACPTTNRVKLPEIEPEPPRTRPTSSSTIRPPSSSLLHQQRGRRLIAEFRERDSRLVEAKKKAVEIARERRKSNLNQLTAEDIKRRIRSRVGDGTSSSPTFLNPTKQSELRKTLTHLERLEMLSKQDLNAVGGGAAAHESGDGNSLMTSSVMMLNNLPSKGIPSWRRSGGGGGGGDYF